MHAADIKALIEKGGSSSVSIAERARVSQATVHRVIRGKSKNVQVAIHIAATVGKPVSQLWPGMYSGLELIERYAGKFAA